MPARTIEEVTYSTSREATELAEVLGESKAGKERGGHHEELHGDGCLLC